MYTFIAKGLKKVADLNLDAGEKITLKPVTFDEFIELGSDKNFYEKEIVIEVLKAKFDKTKREELKKLFSL